MARSSLQTGLRGRACVGLLVSGVVVGAAFGQVGLPRMAVSVPIDRPLSVGVQAAEACDVKGKIVVLPAIPFQSSAAGDGGALLAAEQSVVGAAAPSSGLWLRIDAGTDSLTGTETEKQLNEKVDALVGALPLAPAGVDGLIVEVREPRIAAEEYAFELVRLALTAKSKHAGLRLAFVFDARFIERHGDIVKRLATYADLLGTSYGPAWQKDAAFVAEEALNKPMVLKLDASDSGSAEATLAAELASSGSSVEMIWVEPEDRGIASADCALNSSLRRVVPGTMLRLTASAAPLTLSVDGVSADETWVFGSGQSADTVIVARVNARADQQKQLTLLGTSAIPYEVQWLDAVTGAHLAASDAAGRMAMATSEYVLVSLHQRGDVNSTVYSSVDVKSGVQLSVEEIIARWQQYREAQRAKLAHYQATSFLNLHFESTNVVPAFDISMRMKQFFDRAGHMELAQTDLYVNGVKFNNKYEFPLPQIEPEKVLSQPLELELNERYAYKLLGTEQVNGAMCYVVGVEPKVQDVALYSGKIWIDAKTFREVKQTLSQHGAGNNVVGNVETQNYELVVDGKGGTFNLLGSISAQQTLNAAGRDFLLQRTVQYSDYAINMPGFGEALEAEHRSTDPMYRDTDAGLKSLKKEGEARVVVENSPKRISSIVGGAMYEGTFNFPIPIAGLTISDFDYRHTGAQLSTFFAGPLLAVDLSKQYGSKYRLSADLALSAIPGDDRVYVGTSSTEVAGAEMYAWGETTGLRAAWLATTHLSVTATGYLEYDFYHATSNTSAQYVTPRDGVQFIPGAQVRFTDKGYTFTSDGSRGQRIAWTQFGCSATTLQVNGCGPVKALEPGYTLYDADLNKDYYFKKFMKGGWDASYYGGNQLDRFSRYYPSIFSAPNVHGIPSGTDSFDALAMANVHYGFDAMNVVKFQEMYSYARARNLDESSQFRKFDGLETQINTPGPFGTLIQSTISYALDGNIDRYNSRWGALFMIFKPLH